ncbi:MAG TPA: A24 family peptidase [Aeromicrobium sp.]|nr:A24 family peptidase [Aeromicrobium sp.]
MTIAVAVVAAAVVAALGPWAVAHLPEPTRPAEGKPLYVDIAHRRGARWWMVVPAAVAAGLVAWRVETVEILPAWVLLCGVGGWLAFVDWHSHYLPFRITAPLYLGVWLLVGLAAVLLGDRDVAARALVANVVVYLVFRLIYWVAARFLGGAFGFGDVRLAAILAVALGPLGREATLVGLYAGFVLGAVLGLVLQRLKVVAPGEIAFGPYLLAGAVVGAAWGPAFYGR